MIKCAVSRPRGLLGWKPSRLRPRPPGLSWAVATNTHSEDALAQDLLLVASAPSNDVCYTTAKSHGPLEMELLSTELGRSSAGETCIFNPWWLGSSSRQL